MEAGGGPGPEVDVHAHTFNAADLPVEGFLRRVIGQRLALVAALAPAVDHALERATPGAEEIAELDRLLAAEAVEPAEPVEAAGPPGPEMTLTGLRAETDALVAELDPALAAAADREAAADYPGSDGARRVTLADLRRYVAWVLLFGRRRLTLTSTLLALSPGLDLAVTLMVDFPTLGDAPRTSVVEQLELQERLSRLSLQGRLGGPVVLPFVGFDPRRPDALPLVRRAVGSYGAVGVKVYPTMGFRPFGNADRPPLGQTAERAAAVDAALSGLYDLCVAEDVPITSHANASVAADDSYLDFPDPDHWARVLQRWPGLRLNLGHFGLDTAGWPERASALMTRFTHLYADVADLDPADLPATVDRLDRLFSDPVTAAARERVMFGSDWYMAARHREFEQFPLRSREAYRARFGPTAADAFGGGTALRFLGFDDPASANAARLRRRCADLGVDPPAWLATADTPGAVGPGQDR